MRARSLFLLLGLVLVLGAGLGIGWQLLQDTRERAALPCRFDVVSCTDAACTGGIETQFGWVPAEGDDAPELRMTGRPASLVAVGGAKPRFRNDAPEQMTIRFEPEGDEMFVWFFAAGDTALSNAIGMGHATCAPLAQEQALA